MNFHTSIDFATVVLLPTVAFFLMRFVTHHDALERRVNRLSQRMTAVDGQVENV